MHDVKERARAFVKHLQTNPTNLTDEVLATIAVIVYATDDEFEKFRGFGVSDTEAEALINRAADDLGLTE